MTTAATIDKPTTTPAPPTWEAVPCALCGSTNHRLYHRETLNYFQQPTQFTIVRCTQCGLVFTNPRITQHNAPYSETIPDNDQIESHARAKLPVFQNALNTIQKLQKRYRQTQNNSLLDVGCGSGHFLFAAQHFGFKTRGLEPTPAYAQYAQQHFNLDIINLPIEQAQIAPESFDVITAFDVIEHVPDPQQFLQTCARWLKPKGLLALRFPSAPFQKLKAQIYHQLLRTQRPAFAPTIHLTFFDTRTIAQMANSHQLKVVHAQNTLAETNTDSAKLNRIKTIANELIRYLPVPPGRLANLDIYCQKVPS